MDESVIWLACEQRKCLLNWDNNDCRSRSSPVFERRLPTMPGMSFLKRRRARGAAQAVQFIHLYLGEGPAPVPQKGI